MKIRDYIKEYKIWFLLITYAFLLAIGIYKFDYIIKYLNQIYSLLEPVILAIGIAYVLNIPMTTIEKILNKIFKENTKLAKLVRPLSIFLTFVLTFMVLGLAAFTILPELIKTVSNLIVNLVHLINQVITNADKVLAFFHIDIKQVDTKQVENILNEAGINYQQLFKHASNLLSSISGNIFSIISYSVIELGRWVLSIMISVYFLASKEKFITQLRMLCLSFYPKDKIEDLFKTFKIFNEIFKSFAGGQLLECIILGILIYGGLTLFNMPYAVLIATLTALCALIPIFGAIISWVVGFFLILSIDPIKAVIFLAVYETIQQIENNFIYPKVVGNSVGLPAIWTLISIIVFGGLYGIIGMIMAVPLTACIYYVVKEKIVKRMRKRKVKITEEGYIIDHKTYSLK